MNESMKKKLLPPNIIMILPVQFIMLFLIIIPTILVIWFSVINFQPTFGVSFWEAEFVGLYNYSKILADKDFANAVARTIYVSLICLVVEFFVGLILASTLIKEIHGKKILFPILIIPLMIAPIVVGNNFWLLFSANGPINQMISLILNTDFRVSWFSHPKYALISIIFTEIWHWYPLTFLVLFSGFASLPISEIRAAEILGASEWQIFWRIKFPKLKGVIAISLVIRTMEALKVFDTIYLLTQGGPGTLTESLSYYLFKHGFTYSRISHISAGAWIVLFVCIISFSLALRSVLIKKE